MHIAVDFDDVLYPYHRFLRRRVLGKWGIDLGARRVTTFYYEDLPEFRRRGITRDQVWQEVRATWSEADNHAQSPLLDPEAGPTLRALTKKHKVEVVSARTQEALPHVEAFLLRHSIRPHKILLGRHEKKGFDVLIDDFPKHALENVESGGYSLLYTIDENSTFDESRHPRLWRVHSWSDVKDAIGRLEKRRPTVD